MEASNGGVYYRHGDQRKISYQRLCCKDLQSTSPKQQKKQQKKQQREQKKEQKRLEKEQKRLEKDEGSEANWTRSSWSARFSSGAAVSLSVLEVKRLLLLTLEILVNSRTIRFTGALVPMLLSFIDFGLGFPVAIATIHAIRKPSCVKKCKTFGRIAFILIITVILNSMTVVLFGLKLNVSTDMLSDSFKSSMDLYANNISSKIVMDELQLDLECCGYSGYSDWFGIDWQGTDSAAVADDAAGEGSAEGQGDNGQAVQEDKSVPFSCCDRRTLFACCHIQMSKDDEKTINSQGCAPILHKNLLKISLIGSIMTAIILFNQVTMIVLLVKFCKFVVPGKRDSWCSWESGPYDDPILPLYNRYGNNSQSDCATRDDQSDAARPGDKCLPPPPSCLAEGCRPDCPGRGGGCRQSFQASMRIGKMTGYPKPRGQRPLMNPFGECCQCECAAGGERDFKPNRKIKNPPIQKLRSLLQDANAMLSDASRAKYAITDEDDYLSPDTIHFDRTDLSSGNDTRSGYSTFTSGSPGSSPSPPPIIPCRIELTLGDNIDTMKNNQRAVGGPT